MREIVAWLLQANLAGAASILLVALLRKPALAAFGARTAYGLWLLVPITTAASLAPPRSQELLPAVPIAPAALIEAAGQTATNFWNWSGEAPIATGMDAAAAGLALWTLGVLVTGGWIAWRQFQFVSRVRDGIAGPAVVGFLRPRIVVPADFEQRFDPREQAVVLAHEKVHLARQDSRLNAAVALARCICWFNPLAHVGARLMRIDQELACDAVVVAHHPKARGPYAQALLKAQLAARPLPVGCYWPSGGDHPLTERIALLKRSDPSPLRRVSGGALIAVLTAGAGYAAWAAAPVAVPAAGAPLRAIYQSVTPDPEPAPPGGRVTAPPPARPSVPRHKATLKRAVPGPCAATACSDRTRSMEPFTARVPYVGPAPVPADQPWARYYDAALPDRIRGSVVDVRLVDGMQAEVMVRSNGRLYRVTGANPATMTPEARKKLEGLVGDTVDVSGYRAHDRTCDGGCLMNVQLMRRWPTARPS